jgi:hypothetical protein
MTPRWRKTEASETGSWFSAQNPNNIAMFSYRFRAIIPVSGPDLP